VNPNKIINKNSFFMTLLFLKGWVFLNYALILLEVCHLTSLDLGKGSG